MAGHEKKHNSLTFNNLRLISTSADKIKSIDSYIRSQKGYLPFYESEGLAYRKSWDAPSPLSILVLQEVSRPKSPAESLLLIPRAPDPSTAVIAETDAENTVSSEECSNLTTSSKSTSSTKGCWLKRGQTGTNLNEYTARKPTQAQSNRQGIKTRQLKHTARKRKRSDDSDHVIRLTERRSRRAAKNAIIKPTSSQGEVDIKIRRIRKGEKEEAPGGKLVTGLSLMHGFKAPNVGCGRMTLKPSGFYSNGKASSKTAVKSKYQSQNAKAKLWTEEMFLGLQRRQPCSNHEESVQAATPATTIQRARKYKICNYDHKKKRESARQISPTGNDDRGSIVWDIEQEGVILKDCGATNIDSVAGEDERSQIVKDKSPKERIQRLSVTADISEEPGDHLRRQDIKAYSQNDENSSTSSSLRPSHSASQGAVPIAPANASAYDTRSKYFHHDVAEESSGSRLERLTRRKTASPQVDITCSNSPNIQKRGSSPNFDHLTNEGSVYDENSTPEALPPPPIRSSITPTRSSRSSRRRHDAKCGSALAFDPFIVSGINEKEYQGECVSRRWSPHRCRSDFDDAIVHKTPQQHRQMLSSDHFLASDDYNHQHFSSDLGPIIPENTLQQESRLYDVEDHPVLTDLDVDSVCDAVNREVLLVDLFSISQLHRSLTPIPTEKTATSSGGLLNDDNPDDAGGIISHQDDHDYPGMSSSRIGSKLGLVEDGSEERMSSLDDNQASFGTTDGFDSGSDMSRAERYPTLLKAEETVAKHLKGHWLPQKF